MGVKEHKGHWQKIKYTLPKDLDKECRPYVTYQGRRFYVDQFTNWGNPGAPYTYSEGYAGYILEVDSRGEKARVTYCPPTW